MNVKKPKLCFLADKTPSAQKALEALTNVYGSVSGRRADIFVVLGGDGFMLQMLHKHLDKNKPFYGMNCGTVGFLLNRFKTERTFVQEDDEDEQAESEQAE